MSSGRRPGESPLEDQEAHHRAVQAELARLARGSGEGAGVSTATLGG
ncbi:MAG: hypothetical protein ACRD0L_05750 [Acidimicrobiales bacterium]